MKHGREIAIAVASVCALRGLLTIAANSAWAEQSADFDDNKLLQQRLGELAQAIPNAGAFYTQGAPPAPSAGAGLVGGSFPRSFLIPGTDTSLRVGGEIRLNLTYYFTGRSPNVMPTSSNVLGNGLLAAPLHIHNAIAGGIVVPSSNPTRSRSQESFSLTPQQSRINFETRTPTAFGEVRTFVDFDWAGSNAFAPDGVNPLSSTDSLAPRLRYAYGTLGGLLAGQANSNFSDPDADPPQLEFGGQVGSAGVSKIPQVRYTVSLASYDLPGALSMSAEAPETEPWTAGQGQVATDTGANTTTTISGSTATCTSSAVTALGATPTITYNIGGNLPAFNPTKSPAPDLTAAWYIPQPWGHLDMSLVFRPTLQFKDGLLVDKTMVGYGGHIGGDFKPGWFGWAKDDITFHALGGEGIGRYVGGNLSMVDIVSNYPALSPTDALTASMIKLKTVTAFGGNSSYRHWWTDSISSYAAVGIQHMDLPNNLRTIPVSATGAVGIGSTGNNPVCPGGINAARLAGTGGCGLNRELVSASFGTVWSLVPFVDVGAEYAYGHRLTLSGLKGDINAAISRFLVRF